MYTYSTPPEDIPDKTFYVWKNHSAFIGVSTEEEAKEVVDTLNSLEELVDTLRQGYKEIEERDERIKNLVEELSVLEENEKDCEENFNYQVEEKAKWLGAIWNAVFPDEWDTWEYPAQAYRLSLAQIVWMRNFLRKLFLQGWQDDADELEDILNAKAGEAPYVPSSQYEYQED